MCVVVPSRCCCPCSPCLSLGAAAGSDVADAVMRGDAAAVRALLAQKADVNATQADGATALHWAVYRADPAMTDLLLQAGANPKVANSEGATPLSLACMNGNAAIMESLLKAGADPNEALPRGETALMMASRTGNVAAMKVLLDRGAQVNAKESLRGTTALMWAADQGHAAAMQAAHRSRRGSQRPVESRPSRQDRVSGQGERSPEIEPGACRRGRRCDTRRGCAPGAARAATRVSPRRPQPGQPAAAPQPQQEFREEQDLSGGGLPPLAFATRANSIEAVKVLLAAGADINQATGYGWTPLLVATHNRFYRLGSFLLDKGADPNKANNGGWTPLVPRRGQPQHRKWRLSGPQGRHGPPGLHQEAARQGRGRECADEGQH